MRAGNGERRASMVAEAHSIVVGKDLVLAMQYQPQRAWEAFGGLLEWGER